MDLLHLSPLSTGSALNVSEFVKTGNTCTISVLSPSFSSDLFSGFICFGGCASWPGGVKDSTKHCEEVARGLGVKEWRDGEDVSPTGFSLL